MKPWQKTPEELAAMSPEDMRIYACVLEDRIGVVSEAMDQLRAAAGASFSVRDPRHPGLVPEILVNGLRRYADQRIATGRFLRAILENKLHQACARADPQNVRLIPAIAAYVFNTLPSRSWGSPERVKAWLARREDELPEPEEDLS